MKTQISRNSHDPSKRYSGIYQQQGRMLTDADWNELVSIINERLSGALLDVVGGGEPVGRRLSIDNDLKISPGSVYADGLTVTLPADSKPFTYADQPDFPKAPGAPASGESLYADLWERPVLFLEDPKLRDPGLHGADTCTRTKMMLQIKRCPNGVNPMDPLANPGYGNALLTLSQRPSGTEAQPQSTTANYLFRLEVHDVKGNARSPSELTLKWSSENAAEVYTNDRDVPGDFKGDWLYEFYNDTSESHLGVHLVGTADFPVRGKLMAGYPVSPPAKEESPYVRRWDGRCVLSQAAGVWSFVTGEDRGAPLSTTTAQGVHGHVKLTTENNSVFLRISLQELELELKLGDVSNATTVSRTFVAGDFWLAPVRDDAPGTKLLDGAPSIGIIHRYVKLGVVGNNRFIPERTLGFPSLTKLLSSASNDSGAAYVGAESHSDVAGATTVQAQLSALLKLLNKANDASLGAALMGNAGISGSPRSLSAGNVREQLAKLLDHLNTHTSSTSTDHDNRYFTETEADARFAPKTHHHDDRYFTETEADARFAATAHQHNNYSIIGHAHDERYLREIDTLRVDTVIGPGQSYRFGTPYTDAPPLVTYMYQESGTASTEQTFIVQGSRSSMIDVRVIRRSYYDSQLPYGYDVQILNMDSVSRRVIVKVYRVN